jgi:hypothetical protein
MVIFQKRKIRGAKLPCTPLLASIRCKWKCYLIFYFQTYSEDLAVLLDRNCCQTAEETNIGVGIVMVGISVVVGEDLWFKYCFNVVR